MPKECSQWEVQCPLWLSCKVSPSSSSTRAGWLLCCLQTATVIVLMQPFAFNILLLLFASFSSSLRTGQICLALKWCGKTSREHAQKWLSFYIVLKQKFISLFASSERSFLSLYYFLFVRQIFIISLSLCSLTFVFPLPSVCLFFHLLSLFTRLFVCLFDRFVTNLSFVTPLFSTQLVFVSFSQLQIILIICFFSLVSCSFIVYNFCVFIFFVYVNLKFEKYW